MSDLSSEDEAEPVKAELGVLTFTPEELKAGRAPNPEPNPAQAASELGNPMASLRRVVSDLVLERIERRSFLVLHENHSTFFSQSIERVCAFIMIL